jgi:hypothetical protein
VSREPTRVELFEDGERKLVLTRSERGSLNGRNGYKGRASRVRIHGPVGSIATFYDDQQFREGENHVLIEKRLAEPVNVPLSSDFVGLDDAQGEKAYLGQTDDYKYIFFRKRKPEWWEELVQDLPGGQLIFDTVKNLLEESNDPRVKGSLVVVNAVFRPPDENYHFDNCSSVRFGE